MDFFLKMELIRKKMFRLNLEIQKKYGRWSYGLDVELTLLDWLKLEEPQGRFSFVSIAKFRL
jgi:hypothetical protein